jgi:uncharacterized membrane protein
MTKRKHNRLLTGSLILATLAAILAGYLLWATTGERAQVFGCGEGSGCNKVLRSRWSLWLGQPVSLFAIGFYALFLFGILALRTAPEGKTKWLPGFVSIAASAGLVILWFIGIQVVVIGSFCAYCLTDHGLGLLAITGLLIYARQSGVHPGIAAWSLAPILAGSFIALHILVAPTRIQVEDIPPQPMPIAHRPSTNTLSPSASQLSRRVYILDRNVNFDIYQIPHLGSPEAEFVMVELFDYTCSHCRDLHRHLEEALDRYQDQLAIVTLPVPMHSACNPNITRDIPVHEHACVLAEYSLAVCTFDRNKFAPYHNWLMQGKAPPNPEAAREKAESLLGVENFNAALKEHWVSDWMADGRALHGLGNFHGIPKLLVGKQIANVSHIASPKLFELIENALGIKPKAQASQTTRPDS